jgi:hypothetical protein
MRARLLITYPAGRIPDGTTAPFAPSLLIESGETGLFTSDWVRNFGDAPLDTITETEIRRAMRLDDTIVVHLSTVRELPEDDLYSEMLSCWRQEWWQSEIAALRQGDLLAKAS